MWRSLGIASTIASDLVNYFPDQDYSKEAISYAQKELDFRLAAGENSGFNLLNAYHTLGVAQSELADKDKSMYVAARNNLNQAKAHAQALGKIMVVSVLDFREAWLEYMANPSNKVALGNLVQGVLDEQQQEASRWDNGVRNALQAQMNKLATHLGGAYQQQTMQMYSA